MKILYLILLLGMLSCHSNVIYKEEISIPQSDWSYAKSLEYTWTISDTTQIFDINLYLNHTPDLPYQNVYVKCYTQYPDSHRLEQVLSLELLDASGKPNGKCRFGTCISDIPLQENIRFPIPGTYSLRLEQFSRDSVYTGIQKIGLQILKSE